MMNSIFRIIVAVLFALTLYPSAALARTTLFFEAPAQARPEVPIPVVLRARLTESVNAVRVVVRFDPSRLTITGVDDRDSVIRHWLELPHSSASGSLALEGIIPGGVGPGLTDTVTIAHLTVQASRTGPGSLNIGQALVYLNQSDGRIDTTELRPVTIAVRADAPQITVVESSQQSVDADVRVVREPTVNDGAWSLVFDVRTEKGTVPVRIRERFLGVGGAWHDAQSPYRLSDQRLTSIIEVGVASGSSQAVVRTIVPGRLQSIIALLAMAAIVTALRWWRLRKG